ncbi:MAG TPA: BadF/BadG/BcrA/BcrD ATPase family protein [Candidatus Limnocylindrales bacterium]|nr:BadF/BadG/BcrA/BcrD ATPase family protein [Candidatus Limnocylindrales bacterium]
MGVDAGGTSLTAAAIDAGGEVVAVHRGRSVNAFAATAAGATSAQPVDEALRAILAETGDRSVGGLVVGLAGSSTQSDVREDLGTVAATLGLATQPLVVNDAEAMYATGTVAASGSVLVAGTGAIAMAVRDRRATWRADGHGWLVGDAGSAVWIGLHGVRAVLGAIESRSEGTSLADELPVLLGRLSGREIGADPQAMVVAVHELKPATLGSIAPLVDRHAASGDRVARAILRSAVRQLTMTLAAVVERGGQDLPIVVGGSVAFESATVRRGLERTVARRWPGAALTVVRTGAAGAALWARGLAGNDHDDDLLRAVRARVETFGIDQRARK